MYPAYSQAEIKLFSQQDLLLQPSIDCLVYVATTKKYFVGFRAKNSSVDNNLWPGYSETFQGNKIS